MQKVKRLSRRSKSSRCNLNMADQVRGFERERRWLKRSDALYHLTEMVYLTKVEVASALSDRWAGEILKAITYDNVSKMITSGPFEIGGTFRARPSV